MNTKILIYGAVLTGLLCAAALACPPPPCLPVPNNCWRSVAWPICWEWKCSYGICCEGECCYGGIYCCSKYNCCPQPCCNGDCCNAAETCCGGEKCCFIDECCNGNCCDSFMEEDCCEGITCYKPGAPYEEQCCHDGNGTVCPKDKICCQGECVTTKCIDLGTCEYDLPGPVMCRRKHDSDPSCDDVYFGCQGPGCERGYCRTAIAAGPFPDKECHQGCVCDTNTTWCVET